MESSPDVPNAEELSAPERASFPGPSAMLLAAAMMGLLGGGCDGGAAEPEPDPSTCTCSNGEGGQTATTTSTATGGSGGTGGGTGGTGATGGGGGEPSKIISEVPGNRTFADLKAECDQRGGFTQVHAACAGVNGCAGFSYGDWDPGVLTEHSCAAVNGCNGISCVVLPADSGKTGKEIYEEALPETGPRSCSNCHAVWDENGPDFTKFKLYLLPGSPRNASNWLDYPAGAQARTVAFGKQGLLDDGSAFSNMAGYHKVYSRAEIERVVDHIRTELEVVPATIKTAD
jgi:hypothetical protein